MPSTRSKIMTERDIKAAAILESFNLAEITEILESNIFDLMGVQDKLDQAQKDDLSTVFAETVENRVVARVLEMMSESEQEEYKVIVQDDLEKADQYLTAKGIDRDQIAVAETVLYKLELISNKRG